MLKMRVALLLCVVTCLACGQRPRYQDAGPDEVDAAVPDAGRTRGEDPPNGYLTAVPNADAGVLTRVGVGVAMALDQNAQPLLAYIVEDPDQDGVHQDDQVRFTRW